MEKIFKCDPLLELKELSCSAPGEQQIETVKELKLKVIRGRESINTKGENSSDFFKSSFDTLHQIAKCKETPVSPFVCSDMQIGISCVHRRLNVSLCSSQLHSSGRFLANQWGKEVRLFLFYIFFISFFLFLILSLHHFYPQENRKFTHTYTHIHTRCMYVFVLVYTRV